MSEVTRILSAIGHGDPHAAGQLLPLVNEKAKNMVKYSDNLESCLGV
jgi:hypothetical protein